jgi:galactokinase
MRSHSADSTSLARDLQIAQKAFRQTYDCEPQWAACAPGRVNLIGEHVDYNDGLVLPMAINRQTVVVGGGRSRGGVALGDDEHGHATRVYSQNLDELHSIELPAASGPKRKGWVSYVQGVLALMEQRSIETGPMDLVVRSSVPLGGGLSSSAALEVAVATLIEAVAGTRLPPLEKIRLCQAAEHRYAEVPCGIMDQFAVTLSQANHLMLLDCRSLEPKMISVRPPAPAIVIINSNVRHELGNTQYARRRQECQQATAALGVRSLREVSRRELERESLKLDAVVYRRARHVVSEIERTGLAAAALRDRNWCAAGELMYQSHASLRDEYEVSCRELDVLVELAQQCGTNSGVYGARMTGGGFGGCVVALVEPSALDRVRPELVDGYRRATGIEPSWMVTDPSPGARELSDRDGFRS